MWTIHDIEVVFHHYYSTSPWARGRTEAYSASVEKLFEAGLMDRADFPHVTPKGVAFINMLRRTPCPVEGYYDPRIDERVTEEIG